VNAPLPVPTTWTTGTTEAIHTGTWRAATPRHIAAPSPCHQACPVGGDIATWIGQARSGDLHGAWLTLVRHNPFPAIAGRICHHPCEAACNRGGHDEALSICRLERYVGDQALDRGWDLPAPAVHPAPATWRWWAAGRPGSRRPTSCAARATASRCSRPRPNWAVSCATASRPTGCRARCSTPRSRASSRWVSSCAAAMRWPAPHALDELACTHDAVFVALGAQQPKALAQIDTTRPWFMDGARYLSACSQGTPPALGARVVVVGGGSAAIDVARSARRQGHAVTLLALERRAQMPAQRDEVDEALEEGITLVDGALLQGVDEGDAALTLRCQRVDFVAGAERGRFDVRPLPGSGFTLAADAVLAAIGQDPRLDDLGGHCGAAARCCGPTRRA
jgi:NADPH-dependent glutamate synthase beta subunit-like oxidoreductase